MSHHLPRRDRCHLIGKRAALLDDTQAAVAWRNVAEQLRDTLSTKDIPKFEDLLRLIREATVAARNPKT